MTRPDAGDRWSYKGCDIFRTSRNSAGLRWETFSLHGRLRADTKDGMRELITATYTEHGINYREAR